MLRHHIFTLSTESNNVFAIFHIIHRRMLHYRNFAMFL